MIFSAEYNRMLNYMLKDNRMKDLYLTYIAQLSDEMTAEISSAMCNKKSVYLMQDLFTCTVITTAFERSVRLTIENPKLGYMEVAFGPISREELGNIPLDNEYDIFLEPDKLIHSPAQFCFKYSKSGNSTDPDVHLWYNIVKKNTSGKDEYYLVSQEYSDAGLRCTKVDIDDFITEIEDYKTYKRKVKLNN